MSIGSNDNINLTLKKERKMWMGHYDDHYEWFIVWAEDASEAALLADDLGPVEPLSIRPLNMEELIIGFRAEWCDDHDAAEIGRFIIPKPNIEELNLDEEATDYVAMTIKNNDRDLNTSPLPEYEEETEEEIEKRMEEYRVKVMGEKPRENKNSD